MYTKFHTNHLTLFPYALVACSLTTYIHSAKVIPYAYAAVTRKATDDAKPCKDYTLALPTGAPHKAFFAMLDSSPSHSHLTTSMRTLESYLAKARSSKAVTPALIQTERHVAPQATKAAVWLSREKIYLYTFNSTNICMISKQGSSAQLMSAAPTKTRIKKSLTPPQMKRFIGSAHPEGCIVALFSDNVADAYRAKLHSLATDIRNSTRWNRISSTASANTSQTSTHRNSSTYYSHYNCLELHQVAQRITHDTAPQEDASIILIYVPGNLR